MPELPEVEVVRMGLEKVLLGKRFRNVKVGKSKIVTSNSNKRVGSDKKVREFITGVTNKIIKKIERRAKNIIIYLEDESLILIHLKMTGQVLFNTEATKHTHIIFELDNGELLYNDVRGFGYVLYFESMAGAYGAGHFKKLGLEPFDKNFTLEYFENRLKKLRKNIKKTLLDQDIVVGCGNIYADEICFASNIMPTRICSTLEELEIKNIYKNIISILSAAIESGGSSISDYKNINGESGSYASKHKVYGKAGKPCINCKTLLNKIIISGRSTVYCSSCQQ